MYKVSKKREKQIRAWNPEPDEQLRMIRTHIQQVRNGFVSSIMIMSPEENENQPLISRQLGVAFAETGKNVLLVDANIYSPSLHQLFFLKNEMGFIEAVGGQPPEIRSVKTLGLSVLTAGAAATFSQRLWTIANFKKVVVSLEAAFDVVIFNAPPLLETADAQILSSLCSDILLVTTENKTKEQHLVKTKILLERTGKKLTGVIYQKR